MDIKNLLKNTGRIIILVFASLLLFVGLFGHYTDSEGNSISALKETPFLSIISGLVIIFVIYRFIKTNRNKSVSKSKDTAETIKPVHLSEKTYQKKFVPLSLNDVSEAQTSDNTPDQMPDETIIEEKTEVYVDKDELIKQLSEIKKEKDNLKHLEEIKGQMQQELIEVSEKLEYAFSSFGISIHLKNSFVKNDKLYFTIKPGQGVKISKIKNILLDVSVCLGINELSYKLNTAQSEIVLYCLSRYSKQLNN